ncbi:MAG: 1-acyl-sn-glycerol-3-phosphate acyltransferase [Pseudomonadota bacterium]
MTQLSRNPTNTEPAALDGVPKPHIVDQLIEERAENLRRNPRRWTLIRRLLYPVLGYRRGIAMVEALRPLRGSAVFEWLSEQLTMRVSVTGREFLPERGPIVIVANHPAGIADGIAVWDALKPRRRDVSFFANRDAIRTVPGLEDVIIPVEWVEDKRTHRRSREMVRQVLKTVNEQRVIVIFPSGRLARATWRGLEEREWLPTAIGLAQKYRCPVLPMHIRGRNSLLYYLFYFINSEIRDMTLFRELLNKRFQKYTIHLGEPFHPVGDSRIITPALRTFVAEAMREGAVRFELGDQVVPVEAEETRGFDKAANGA